MSRLIYCDNKAYFRAIDKSLRWDYYLADTTAEYENYINTYFPDLIIICESKIDESACIIEYVRREYKKIPTIFICSNEKVLTFFTSETEKRKILSVDKIPDDIDRICDELLMHYNFLPHLKGYTYIKRALYEGFINDGAYFDVKKILYSNLALMYFVSESSVERSISFSISKAYEKGNELKELFSFEKIPSNLVFLKRFFICVKKQAILQKSVTNCCESRI